MPDTESRIGIISAKQGKQAGLSYMKLSRLVKQGKLERVARGVYESMDEPDDILYVEQLRRPKIVYSHSTALYLHDLTDHDNVSITVTVPAGYNTMGLLKEGFKAFSVKREMYESDIIELPTNSGHLVRVYGLERTIVDVVRSRNKMDPEIVTTALKRFALRKGKNVPLLSRTAERFGVSKLITTFMLVLL
ncbi:MAG: type IV toxin-antitoxin system AbiEi family antitoxin domain-containing protein [Deltaproteobacteria bacterium]|jgi:predicted transcriptional regulator of viral defense system|nr:type IV toxin-antitoxin system AbiEi family antitoxin domain-containing protein [Deltaproteobacteria bacterium]